MSDFGTALLELEALATATATDPVLYPLRANLTHGSGPAVVVRLRLVPLATGSASDERMAGLTPSFEGVFPPGVVVRVGDTLTVLEPADLAGQGYEVTLPITPDRLGYRAGLGFLEGSR